MGNNEGLENMKLTKKQKNKYLFAFSIIAAGIIIGFAAILLIKICIPLAISLVGMFLALIKIYPQLDLNLKFIGGCFFVVAYWYILNAFAYVGIRLLSIGTGIISKVLGRDKK